MRTCYTRTPNTCYQSFSSRPVRYRRMEPEPYRRTSLSRTQRFTDCNFPVQQRSVHHNVQQQLMQWMSSFDYDMQRQGYIQQDMGSYRQQQPSYITYSSYSNCNY